MGNMFNKNDYGHIVQRINNLTPDTKAQWGKMNVNEMICHISDPVRDLLGERKSQSSMPFFLKPVMKMMLLSKRPFGKNLPTSPFFRQGAKGKGTAPESFDADKYKLLRILNTFHATPEGTRFPPHAAAGQLTREQNGFLVWKHTDHHLRQFGV
jgi:hypothetical protein